MMNTAGTIVAIFLSEKAGAQLTPRDQVRAVPGHGLEGDRYFNAAGTFSKKDAPGQELTLIESEALEALARDYELRLAPHESRRNLLTRGVALNHLVGREFQVGPVRARGIKLCEPCGHLEKLTRGGVKTGLRHRGGLRAQILSEGVIRPGDSVEMLPS
jgi:MOSC domain-containing protein YiiM